MQEWLSFKQSFIAWAGIDGDALNVLASVLFCLVFALVSRRPLSNVLTWLLVLMLGLINEAATGLSDGRFDKADFGQGTRDLLLFMAVPSVLMLVGRYAPHLIAPRQDRRILIPAIWEKRAPVVEATFRESDRDRPPQASTG